jgi:3-methylfumaryl-CoA hydratase
MAYEEYVGSTEKRTDTVWPLLIRGLAATLDVPQAEVSPNDLLPPLWHWMLFQDWAPASGLGPDGHPKRGGFLPPVNDLPRRMWAGGRVEFMGDLRAGNTVRRTSTILKVEEKTGGTGRLVFVTVRHEIHGPPGLCIAEEQDIVYRGAEGAAVKPAEKAPPPPDRAFTRTVRPDAVMLFRYSALTANGHRIHYDLDYVTKEEGYPGLVVHGPLQATLLADLVRRNRPGSYITRFGFRGRRPAFHQNDLTLLGWEQDGILRLETRDHEGAVSMVAEAVLA